MTQLAHTAAQAPTEEPTQRCPPKVAIVGTGMIAGLHRRGALLAGGHVTAVIGSTPARSRQVATQWGLHGAPDRYDDVLSSDADVVHICTPNATHADYTLKALQAGKHVVCEKPLAVSAQQASELRDAAAAAGRIATVPFVYRYHPVVRELRARRIAGDFGPWHLLHGSYLQDWLLSPTASNWRVDPAQGGASRAFADIGSHWCDLVEFVSGERFTQLTAARSIAHQSRPTAGTHAFTPSRSIESPDASVTTEDSAILLLGTESGTLANVTISQVAAGRKNRLWFELDGTRASAVFDQEHPESAWIGHPDRAETIVRDPAHLHPDAARFATLPAGHSQGYADCFEHFIADTYAAISGAHPEGLPTFEDGYRSALLVDAMLRSSASAQWEPVTP